MQALSWWNIYILIQILLGSVPEWLGLVKVYMLKYFAMLVHVLNIKNWKMKVEFAKKKITYLTRTGKRWASLEFDSIFFLEGLGVGNGKWMIMIIKNKD